MQQFLIPATVTSKLQEAATKIHNRSMLYDVEQNILYVKYNDSLHGIMVDADDKNIVLNDIGGAQYLSLSEDIIVSSTNVCPDNVSHNVNIKLADNAITDQKSIYLIVKVSDDFNETMCGELCRKGETVSEMYHVSFSSKEKPQLLGSSSNSSIAKACLISFAGVYYYGIKFTSTEPSSLYFHGYTNIRNLLPPNYKDYRDSQFTIMEEY